MPGLYLNQGLTAATYFSPALSVVKSTNIVNQDPGTPILDVDPDHGESQKIQAEAGNDGDTPMVDVHVQLWALAFATGVATPLYLASMGGPKGIDLPLSGDPQIDIALNQHQSFTRDWDKTFDLTSTSTDITSHFVNNEVHCCILGNVYGAGDPTSAAIVFDPANPVGPSLNVLGNRHHAQHNMTIKTHAAGMVMGFHMFAANSDAQERQDVVLKVFEHAPRLHPWEVGKLAGLGPWIRPTENAPPGGIAGVELVIDGRPLPLRYAGEPIADLEVDVPDVGAGPQHTFTLDPDEARPITINATIPDEDLVLRVIDITQTYGDRRVDGARLMVLTLPPELQHASY